MQDLAQGVQLSRSGISQLVGRMEAAGLVSRCGAADDGRGTVCSLTSEGVRVFKRAAVVHMRGVQQHFAARYTDQEAVELTGLLRHVIGDWPPPGPECVRAEGDPEI
jgi:DNA-binding MarR family transcriptional regulator